MAERQNENTVTTGFARLDKRLRDLFPKKPIIVNYFIYVGTKPTEESQQKIVVRNDLTVISQKAGTDLEVLITDTISHLESHHEYQQSNSTSRRSKNSASQGATAS